MTADDKTLADEIARALATEEGMNTPGHVIEYEGRTYVTPPIIENDDGKETRSIGEEA
ncbi:hypothetical protein ACTXKN_12505 [Brachybacterium alimentarium]|uniref:hypothetical protein n=1 Tax=Brachybacterium alimentarium TaxID=47845 RepID=UPI003FD68B94